MTQATPKGLRIAVGHKARVGKDTFADYVERQYGSVRVRFASGVYDIGTQIQKYLGMPVRKEPALLQWVGMGLREIYGDNIWVDKVASVIDEIDNTCPEKNIIVVDLRFPNEFALLKSKGFITLNINRIDRPIDRDPNHISEIALDKAEYDYAINNDGTLEEFYFAIDEFIKKIQKESKS